LTQFKILFIRSLKLLSALCAIAFGISFIVKASIGQSTLSGFSYNLGVLLNMKQGTTLGWINLLFFLGQLPILKWKLSLKDFFQLGMILMSTLLTNFFIYDFPWGIFPAASSYPIQLIYLFTGILIMALGISLMMALDFVFMPYEGFLHLISEKSTLSFGKLRRIFDVALVFGSLALILLFKIPNTSVREGTVIFALLVGTLNHYVIPFLKKNGWKEALEH
jgi:uncharacterized membrane protein YczE